MRGPVELSCLARLSPEARLGELRRWLLETNPTKLEILFAAADLCRRESVGDAVHLRGLVEISSHCRRGCHYCGLRASNRKARRYRLSPQEILDTARRVAAAGAGTIVLQAGEDPGLSRDGVAQVVRRIKGETGLAVTLSLGEREDEDYEAWRQAGADRYLLRFETSDPGLYDSIHPPHGGPFDRVAALARLRSLGYQVGSGLLFGLPGQTSEGLARDLALLADLDLHMIGSGPYIPHPETPLGQQLASHEARRSLPAESPTPADGSSGILDLAFNTPADGSSGTLDLAFNTPADGSSGTLDLAFKVIALCRLLAPWAHIPSTTAIATLGGEEARARALGVGANVIMPNFTPARYRAAYEIYPNKACPPEGAEVFCLDLRHRLRALGRTLGTGPGSPCITRP